MSEINLEQAAEKWVRVEYEGVDWVEGIAAYIACPRSRYAELAELIEVQVIYRPKGERDE